MKKINPFMKLHFQIIIFYIIMLITGMFNIDYKLKLPIKHPQIGILFVLGMGLYFVFNKNRKAIINIYKYNINLEKGTKKQKIFKISVILLSILTVLSLFSGLILYSGIISNYQLYKATLIAHSIVRYILILLVILHVGAKYIARKEFSKSRT